MSPKSFVSRSIILAALAISALGLGGCAETTSGQDARPMMAHVPIAGVRLASMTVPRVNPVGPTSDTLARARPDTNHGTANTPARNVGVR